MTTQPDWRAYGPSDLPRVLTAALGAFAEQGYHGTSIRDIAARAKLSVPGLYHHFPSKQDILMALVVTVMDDLIARTEAALESAGEDPRARFDAAVECLLRFHMFRREAAFVASSEGRSLTPDQRLEYVSKRDREQGLIDDVIEAGRASGDFATPFPKDAGRAITTMCIGVASWYREDGPLTPDEIVERYVGFARGVVGMA